MKQLHLSGKIAFALVLTTAAIAGCKDKEPVAPPSPVVETPAVTPPATTPAPAPEAGTVTPPAATTPAPEPAPPAR